MAQKTIDPKQMKFVNFVKINMILAAFSLHSVARNDTKNKAKENKNSFKAFAAIIEVYMAKKAK